MDTGPIMKHCWTNVQKVIGRALGNYILILGAYM